MYYIYQILGNFNYQPVKFKINTIENQNLSEKLNPIDKEQNLASIQVFKSLTITDKKMIFLLPASLDTSNLEPSEKIMKWGLNQDEYETVTIPANGKYNGNVFDYNPDEITFFLYIDMIKRIKFEDTVFIDINAGLNEYVDALNDSISYAYVTIGLKNLDSQNERQSFEVYKIISEPVFRQTDSDEYSVYIKNIHKKIFFSLPSIHSLNFGSTMYGDNQKKRDFNSKFAGNINYTKYVENNIIIFNSIRMNTLSILIKDKSLISKEIGEKLLESSNKILEIYFDTFFKNISHGIRSCKVKSVPSIINFIMSLHLYSGFIDLLEGKLSSIRDPENSDIICLEKLQNFAHEIYNIDKINIPLNSEFLDRDINEWKNCHMDMQKKKDTGSETMPSGSSKRNFFAHSGLDRNTVSYLCHGKVEFKGNLDERKEWLKSISRANPNVH